MHRIYIAIYAYIQSYTCIYWALANIYIDHIHICFLCFFVLFPCLVNAAYMQIGAIECKCMLYCISMLSPMRRVALDSVQQSKPKCKVLLHERCMPECQTLLICFLVQCFFTSILLFCCIWPYTSLVECQVGGCSSTCSCNRLIACSHCAERVHTQSFPKPNPKQQT